MNLVREMDEIDRIYEKAGQRPLFDSRLRMFVLQNSDCSFVKLFREAKQHAIALFGSADEVYMESLGEAS